MDAVAKLLGCAARTVQVMFDAGEFTGFRLGMGNKARRIGQGDRRVALTSVMSYMRANGMADAAAEFAGRYRLFVGELPDERAGELLVESTLIGGMAKVLNLYTLPAEVIVDMTTTLCPGDDFKVFCREVAARAARFATAEAGTKKNRKPRRLLESDRVQLTVILPAAFAGKPRGREIEAAMKTGRGLSDGVLRPVVLDEDGKDLARIVQGPFATVNKELP